MVTADLAMRGETGDGPELHPDILSETLSSVVLEFFESYSVPCVAGIAEPPACHPETTELGSIIGFRGGNVSGGLAFVAPMDLVAKLLPVPRMPDGGDSQIRDWCSEIANQLLGRLKNKVARYDLDFEIGTPVCFFGRSIRLVFLPDAEGTSLSFRAESLDMRVHLDCSYERRTGSASGDEPRIAAEGDVILF